jgi:1-acyl-sn-glycerol-3-phosphate acyltransferase
LRDEPGPRGVHTSVATSATRRTALENTPSLPVAAPAHTPPSTDREERVGVLARVCAQDLISAFGLGGLGPGAIQSLLLLLSSVPARRLAEQVATYDDIVGEAGLPAGGSWAMERMARGVMVEGAEGVPREGPLLVVSNHPGLADAVALFAAMPRGDLRVIAAERPFLSALPNTSGALIPVPDAPNGRSKAVRAAARHLRAGGAVITFPGGRIEPDPAVLPGAAEALADWSGSADLFARFVPNLTVVPAVVSGVISPAALRNPVALVRRDPRDRRWLSATLQMLVPALRDVTTRVGFGPPLRAGGETPVSRRTVEEARRLIEAAGRRLP